MPIITFWDPFSVLITTEVKREKCINNSNYYTCLSEHSSNSQFFTRICDCSRATFTFLHTVFVIKQYVTVKFMFKQYLYVLFTFGRNGNGKLLPGLLKWAFILFWDKKKQNKTKQTQVFQPFIIALHLQPNALALRDKNQIIRNKTSSLFCVPRKIIKGKQTKKKNLLRYMTHDDHEHFCGETFTWTCRWFTLVCWAILMTPMPLSIRVVCGESGWREYDEYDPAVRLFLFAEPVDVLRNQALHDSTLGLQNLKERREIINAPPLAFPTTIMNLLINAIKVFPDPCTC